MKAIIFTSLLFFLVGCASTSSSQRLAQAQQQTLKVADEAATTSIKWELDFRSCVKKYVSENYKKSSELVVATASISKCSFELDAYKYFREMYYRNLYGSQSHSLADLERINGMSQARSLNDSYELEKSGVQFALQRILELKDSE